MLYHMLRCIAFALTLVAIQRNTRIDSDPVLAFLYVVSLHLIAKKSLKYYICVSQFSATQGLASHYEPAWFRLTLTLKTMQHVCTWAILDFRFRLTLTIKNSAACLYMGDERFRLMVQADVNSKTTLACVYMGDDQL